MLSLREVARRHGIDKGQLSRAIKAGKTECKGHAICQYAVTDPTGRVQGFSFPDDYVFPVELPEATPDKRAIVPQARRQEPKPAKKQKPPLVSDPVWMESIGTIAKLGEVSRIVRTTQISTSLERSFGTMLQAQTPQAERVGDAFADTLRASLLLAITGLVGYAVYQQTSGSKRSAIAELCVLGSLGLGAWLGYQLLNK